MKDDMIAMRVNEPFTFDVQRRKGLLQFSRSWT